MTAGTLTPDRTDCWNRIGIGGDRSCPELLEVIHCRNCPVYGAAARGFFDRGAPEGYLEEWTALLASPVGDHRTDDVSLLTFRLNEEWLALRTRVIVEVTAPRPVHHIPHRSGAVLTGLVNLRGQLHLLVSLHGLIGIAPGGSPADRDRGDATRFVVVRSEGASWVFAADEVLGVKRFHRSQLSAVPADLANPAHSFSQAVILRDGRSIGFLDDQRVFSSLKGVGR